MKEKEIMYDCPWGIKSSQKPKENWQEGWECAVDLEDEIYFVTKETYTHDIEEEEKMNFEYKFVIEFLCTYPSEEEEEDKIFATLLMMPLPKYFPKDKIEKIKKENDLPENCEIPIDLLLEYFSCPILENDLIDFKVEDYWTEDKNINNFLCGATCSLQLINGMRGLFLSKAENAIGSTGWDFLRGILTENYDPFLEPIKRFKEKNREEN